MGRGEGEGEDLKEVIPIENMSVGGCEASFLSQNSRMGHFPQAGENGQNVSLLLAFLWPNDLNFQVVMEIV